MNGKSNRITVVLLAVIALLLAVLISIVISKGENHSKHRMANHMNNQAKSLTEDFTGADIMFLQMMIPHHQQAIDISELALKTSKNTDLLSLAKIISRDQKLEIAQMKSWLAEAGASEDMGHSMTGMGGMLDGEELTALARATGKEFDALWLKGMIGHHDGAIHMTQMIEDAAKPEIKAFGLKVVQDQSAQIKEMSKMLG